MITKARYQQLKANYVAFKAWLGDRTSYNTKDIPASVPRVSNDQLSQIELYEFVNIPPDRYTCYVKRETVSAGVVNRNITVTTWTGQVLGYGTLGSMFKCQNSLHYPIRFRGINGRDYYGTYYHSAGDYCHVKACKV